MKYPLDPLAVQEFAIGLKNMGSAMIANDSALRAEIRVLSTLVREAMMFSEAQDTIWYGEAEAYVKSADKRVIDQSNARFNQKNSYKNQTADDFLSNIPKEPYERPPSGSIFDVVDKHAAAKLEQELNVQEASFGEEMNESELANFFGEAPQPNKDRLKKPLSKMSIEEIKDYEAEQDNSNDIYKISARIMNLARGESGKSLGPQQTMLCNTFCHVVKAFYNFAETLPKEHRVRLISLARSQEGVPANLIAAAAAGLKK